MRRLRLLLAVMLVAGVVLVPATATANVHECATVEGHGFLDFGTAGEGRLRLMVDGQRQVVTFFPTGAIETGENMLDIRFVMMFDEGPLVVVEHSVGTPIGDGIILFESDLDIKKGGSGGLYWYGIADQNAGFADIHHVTGEICFDR